MTSIFQIAPTGGIVIEWTLVFFSSVFVALRIHLRYFRQSLFSLSDLIIVLAFVFFVTVVACDSALVGAGFWDSKLTFEDLSPNEVRDLLKMLYASQFPYYCTLWSVKLALLLLYYTLVPKSMKTLRWCLHAVSAIVGTSFVAVLGLNTFFCYPISKNWDGSCVNYSKENLYLPCGGLHILTEILIFILPFPLLRTLQLGPRGRTCMYAMFSLGFITIAVGLGRLACILVMLAQKEEQVIGICQVWGCIEMCISITVVCLPALKGILTGVKERKRAIEVARSGGSRVSRGSVKEMMSFRCRGSGVRQTEQGDVEHAGHVLEREESVEKDDIKITMVYEGEHS